MGKRGLRGNLGYCRDGLRILQIRAYRYVEKVLGIYKQGPLAMGSYVHLGPPGHDGSKA